MVSIDRLSCGLKLLPLLKKQFVFDEITVHHPVMKLYKARDGKTNFDFEIDTGDLFATDNMEKLQEVLNVDGLIVGVVMEYGDWRGKINWGGVVGFSARMVEVDSGLLIWATSANRDMAMINSSVIAHAASQDALKDLLTKLGK